MRLFILKQTVILINIFSFLKIIFSTFSNIGTRLDSESKHWRLVADFLNDFAICIDLLTLLAPSSLFLPMVCVAAVLRSVVGVAGGATKAAVSQHQARRHNLGDVLAKDGSQETAVGLVGLLLSIVVTPFVAESAVRRWSFFAFFTALHLFANYRAVLCVAFDTFNRQRLALLMDNATIESCTPQAVARLERFVLPWHDEKVRSALNGGDIILGKYT